jgi:hypothetical protein
MSSFEEVHKLEYDYLKASVPGYENALAAGKNARIAATASGLPDSTVSVAEATALGAVIAIQQTRQDR